MDEQLVTRGDNPMHAGTPGRIENRYKGREINIQPQDHGFLVRVGCVSFAIAEGDDRDQSIDSMLKKIGKYFKNPSEAEREYEQTGKY